MRKSIEVDLSLINHYDKLLTDLELYVVRTAKGHDVGTFGRSRRQAGTALGAHDVIFVDTIGFGILASHRSKPGLQHANLTL